MGRPELTKKPTIIRFDGAPPTTSDELADNRYPADDDIPVTKKSEIFDGKSS